MKINIIGGGPAGLYFAILMKLADPAHDITVYERNGPDDTFGWGVVFSGRTLKNLRDADPASHAEIMGDFAAWDNVDVVHRDEQMDEIGLWRTAPPALFRSRLDRIGRRLRPRETDLRGRRRFPVDHRGP